MRLVENKQLGLGRFTSCIPLFIITNYSVQS